MRAPAPSDLPEEVRNLLPLIDCGSELIIDPGSPAADPGPGWTPTTANANRQAIDCLMSAWAYRQKAQMTKSQLTAAGDEFYILYRLPGDGSIVVYVRDLTPSEQELLWYTTVCDQLTLDQGQILPTECRNQRTLSEPDD